MPLPPVTQVYEADAAPYLDAIDQMIEATGNLAEAIDEIIARVGDMTGAVSGAADSEGRLAEAVDALTASADRQAGIIDGLVTSVDGLAGSMDEAAAATERNTIALDEQAAAAARTRDSNEEADESTGLLATHGKVAFLGIAAAVGYSVVEAAKFQSTMTQLLTQAGVSKTQFKSLSDGVLQLAGQVGDSPGSLADALYHVESSFASVGIKGPQALNLVKIAAQGASIGHADLVDVTNALDAAIASGIPGVQNYSQAMGALNAIVGSGDMHMQDLADAFGTGLLATVKGFGVSLTDVGAALATFGDNNIRGAKAGSELRMAIQALGAPGTGPVAVAALDKLNLSYTRLATDMQKGGLKLAVTDLQAHMKAAGVTGDKTGEILTDAFGKRAGSGINILIGQEDRFLSKYPDMQKGANDFGKAWQTQGQTVQQRFKDFEESLKSLAITFGTILLPAVDKIMGYLNKFMGYIEKHPVLAKFAGAVLALAIAMGVATVASSALDAAMDANPIMLILIAVLALAAGLYELYKHCKTVRDIVADVGKFFKDAWADAMHAADAVIRWFVSGPLAFIKAQLKVFEAFWKQNGAEIDKIVKAAWQSIWTDIKVAWDLIWTAISVGLDILETAWKIAWTVISVTVKTVWDIIGTIISTAVKVVTGVVGAFLQLLQGHWSKAWNDLWGATKALVGGIAKVIEDILNGLISIVSGIAKAIIQGFINGIKDMAGGVWKAVKDLAGGVISTLKSVLKIFSPSQVMVEIGQFIGDGLVQGLTGSTASKVNTAATKLADLVKSAFSAGAMGAQRYTSLSDFIQNDNTRLQILADARSKILATIKTAQAYAVSVASSTESSAGLANLTSVQNAQNGGAGLYSGDMLGDLQAQLTQIRQFGTAIQRLSKLGLSKDLINQIIQMGPAQGLQVANALLDGPVSVIKQVSQTESQITSASTALGQTAADAMYDSGKAAGQGFLSGLQGQQAAIEAVMKKIADSMVGTIKSELGIHSPSTVARYHGQMFAEGLALGVTDGEGRVAASSKRLTAALTGQAGGGGAIGGGAGGGSGVTFAPQFHLNGVMTSNKQERQAALWPLIQQAALQFNKRNGKANNGLSLESARFG
jgi:TP901 family phage tail tape measure protein